MPIALLETDVPPLFQQMARKAWHLRELGMSLSAIAKRLGVNDKTVAKARWVASETNGP